MAEVMGIIGVNKPPEWTSFDVVAKLRGILKIKRLGHAGTLDPMATGVLPVFVGKAAKACDIMPDRKKEYLAGFKLSMSTDTLDITGKVLSENEKECCRQEIDEAICQFVGDVYQLPPMYSAVKINGKKLYEYARAGKTVERTPRLIHVDSIDLLEYDEKTRSGKLYVKCEKGTYIRSLIDDIGNTVGCGGIMTSLERTYSGGISVEQCRTIEEIAEICGESRLEEIILPVDKVFEDYEKLCLNERNTQMYMHGVKLRDEQVGLCADEKIRRVYGSSGEFLGLAGFTDGLLKSEKNFY